MKNYTQKTLLLLAFGLLSWQTSEAQVSSKTKSGINLDNFDKKTRPNDDFYRYVNGSWLDKTQIPNDKTSWGSFEELYENTNKDVAKILKDASANPSYKSNTDEGKAIALYKTIMDVDGRNKAGIEPLKPYLAKINAIKNVQDLQNFIIEMQPEGGAGFFGIAIGADDKDSNKNSINLMPGRLGLPDRDYYVSKDKDSEEKREKYVAHIARMLEFLNKESNTNTLAEAQSILEIETAMSEPRLDRVERRDARKQYNPMTLEEIQKMTPAIDWKNYFTKLGIAKVDEVIVTQPRYMQALQTIFVANKVDQWKAYLRWSLLNRTAGQLAENIGDANFEFYGKTLNGLLQRRPLDERALQTVNGSIGQALGKLYVQQMFPGEAKVKAGRMIKNIIKAYQIRIGKLQWMSQATKVKAIEKLNQMTIKIGYPDKWEDYSTLSIGSTEEGGSYFNNMRNLAKWEFRKDVNKLGKPVDKTEWLMAPQEVNAYYNPSYNEIVFPAAILQPPFYDYKVDEALNYGGIGAVIGHEISHGFDDSGARYDAKGNLVDWWTEQDLKQFTTLGEALANQYSALEPLPGIHVDGKFTLGENIGDLGGVNAAYDGLQLYLKEQKTKPELIDGFTPEQRFFLSWATIWRTKSRDEAIKSQVKTDPHSPGEYRGYVPLLNVDAFYEAFNIKPGDKMYVAPDKRVKIW